MFFQIARRRRCTTPAPEPLRGFQFPRDGNLCQKDSDSEEATKHFFVNQGQGESEQTSIKFKSVILDCLVAFELELCPAEFLIIAQSWSSALRPSDASILFVLLCQEFLN